MKLSQELENFILDMTALARIPNATSFLTPPEFMNIFIDRLKSGYETVRDFDIDTSIPDKIDDAYTINFSFVASGFNGMQIDDPSTFIDRMLVEFIGIISNLIWGPIYLNNLKHDLPDTAYQKELYKMFGLILSQMKNPIISNDSSLQDIILNEELYSGFKAYVEKNSSNDLKWYGSSNGVLNIAAFKDCNGVYIIDQYQHYNHLIGDNTEFLGNPLVYDEFLDEVKFDDNKKTPRMFHGSFRGYSMTLSDQLLIDRDLIYISGKDIKPRTMIDTKPIFDKDSGDEYLPAIRYNVTVKVRLFPKSSRGWEIFKTDYKTDTKK